MPGRIDGEARTGDYPVMTTRDLWVLGQPHRCFRQVVIGLAHVACSATGDDVFPGVQAALRTGYDMVETFGSASAVLAPIPVSGKDRRPGERNPSQVGNSHESTEPDDGWDPDRDSFRSPHGVLCLDNVRFVAEDEYDCPPQ